MPDTTDQPFTDAAPMAIPAALAGRGSRIRAQLRRVVLRAQLKLVSLSPAVRRTIDVAVSLLALVCIAPILFVAAVAIKATSRGSVFYFQERLGQYGRKFRMYKLRTMVTQADSMKTQLATTEQNALDGVRFKIRNDPRITPVGRVLRKFSIDELPQFWNVFIGDMTLIGPRPPVWREVALYSPRALRRLEVRPGLTCFWQIEGRSDIPFEQQVDLDLDYIDQASGWDELKIVLKTPKAVLTGKGAY